MIGRYEAGPPMRRKQPVLAPVTLNSDTSIDNWNQMSLCNVIQYVSRDWSVNTTEQDIAVEGGLVRDLPLERDGQSRDE